MSYGPSLGNIAGAIAAVIICTIIIISCSGSGEKEEPSAMDKLVPAEMLGWKAQPETEKYDRETIFDYINGAGEVYLSYGFQKVDVTRFSKADAPEISVEIFDMKTPEDAYGVFSHSRESEEEGIGGGYEFGGSLLCFWKGQYFACVRSDEDTPESKDAVFAMARSIDSSIASAGNKPDVVGFLPSSNLGKGSVRYFHSQASLNYHYFLSEENLLHLDTNTQAALGSYNPGNVNLLCVQYPNPDLARAAYDSFIDGFMPEGKETGAAKVENHRWVVAEVIDNCVVIVFDVKHEMAGRTLLKSCAENIQGLTT